MLFGGASDLTFSSLFQGYGIDPPLNLKFQYLKALNSLASNLVQKEIN